MSNLKEEVREVMLGLRPFVEDRIREWLDVNPQYTPPKDRPMTWGFCRGVAAGVEEVLNDVFPQGGWHVTGGYGGEYLVDTSDNLHEFVDMAMFPGGMVDRDGNWNGHFWVSGFDPETGDEIIVDLSADQFGHEEVVVTDGDDPRYRENSLLPPDVMIRQSERSFGYRMAMLYHLAAEDREELLALAM